MATNSHNDESWNRQLEVMWKLEKHKSDNEIKEILYYFRKYVNDKYETYTVVDMHTQKLEILLTYITNLQTIEQQYSAILSENAELENRITNLQEELEEEKRIEQESLKTIQDLQEENKRFKDIAKKMHLWIFLHSGDEQKIYDELGLTEEENIMLGYSGQFRIGGKDDKE